MTSLTFSLAVLCKEINELCEEHKLTLSYYKDEDYGCKSYFFTHLDEYVEDQNGEEVIDYVSREKRQDKQNLVSKIDYHNINNEEAITVFIDELCLLFDREKLYKRGDLTNLVLIAVNHGYDLFQNEHLWRIEAEYKDSELEKIVDIERQEYLKKQEIKEVEKKNDRKLELKQTITKCELGPECKDEKCPYVHVWRCDKCKYGAVINKICTSCSFEEFVKLNCIECGNKKGNYKSENGLCASCDPLEEED
jgi:hypothetical protein